MQFRFHHTPDGHSSPNHVSDVDLVFGDEDAPLAGFVLKGTTIWRTANGLSATLPSRKIGVKDGKDVYYDLLRSVDANGDSVRQLKQTIVNAFLEAHPEAQPAT